MSSTASFEAAPEGLTSEQEAELGRGLTVVQAHGFEPSMQQLVGEFAADIDGHFPSNSGTPRFLHADRLSNPESFDRYGEQLFASLAPTVGYARTPGEIMEHSGFILYPPDNPGYAPHTDSGHYSWPMVRLTLCLAGEGNFWSATTGAVVLHPSDLIFQVMQKGISHGIDTLKFNQRRVVAFWDIPATRSAE